MSGLTGIKGGATFIIMLFATPNRGVERTGSSGKGKFYSVNWTMASERVREQVEVRCNSGNPPCLLFEIVELNGFERA